MKILFLSAAKSIHTVKWVNALSQRGHDIYLVYNSDHEPDENRINKEVKLVKLKYGGTKAYYLNAKELNHLARKIKPDVINAHYASGYGTLARLSKVAPVLMSVWGSDVYDFPNENIIKNKIFKRNIKCASKLASTSNCMADELRKVMGNEKLEIAITPFGVNLEVFNNKKNYKEKQEDVIRIGNIKALESKYGISELIKAVSVLLDRLKRNPNNCALADKIRVEIYGDGNQKEELEKLIKELSLDKIIILKGKIPNTEVPNVLSGLDIFCATSNQESFGVAIVEAMAMNLPVVASDADGFKEVIKDKNTGFVVPKGNVKKIADALEVLVCNKELRIEFGNNGRRRVEALYDFEKNVDTMEKLYRDMIE